MKSYQVPEPGKPLIEVESPTPEPTGSQVIIKTIAYYRGRFIISRN